MAYAKLGPPDSIRGDMKPSKRQRLFALLIAQEIKSLPELTLYPSPGGFIGYETTQADYVKFIKSQSNAKPTSAGYPYHLALKQIEARA